MAIGGFTHWPCVICGGLIATPRRNPVYNTDDEIVHEGCLERQQAG